MNPKLKKIIKENRILRSFAIRLWRLGRKYKKGVLGKNNVIINKGITINVKYDIVGNNNTVEIMQGAELYDMMIFIRGNGHKLRIGNNCHFNGGNVWYEDNNCQIEIGRNTTIESAHLAVTEPNRSIIIGEDCMLSTDIELRTGDSHSIIDFSTKQRINFAQDIKIGNHVWIGARSAILKGVSIGDHSIIGINSVVTKDIPENSIAAGIPAKVIKNNVDWLRERI